jgi:hypothetical protein
LLTSIIISSCRLPSMHASLIAHRPTLPRAHEPGSAGVTGAAGDGGRGAAPPERGRAHPAR